MVELVLISDDESNSNASQNSPSDQIVQLVIVSDSDSHGARNSDIRSPRETERIVLNPLSQPQKTKKKKKRKELNNQVSLNLSEIICLISTLREANVSPVRFNLKFTGQLLKLGS